MLSNENSESELTGFKLGHFALTPGSFYWLPQLYLHFLGATSNAGRIQNGKGYLYKLVWNTQMTEDILEDALGTEFRLLPCETKGP